MIRDRNIADDANIQPHKILGGMASAVNSYLTGELFWVGDDGDAAFEQMASKVAQDHIFTDLDTAIGSCVANRGDVIVCMEGFNQSVIAAGGLDLDVAGITIVFLGTGTSQAKITFGTDVSADMDVDAADITMINPKFVAGIDALTGPIDVNSTDFTMINAEYHDGTSINTKDAVVAEDATRLKILGYRFVDGDAGGTQKDSHIQLNNCDDIVLKGIDIRGDFDVGCIENVTDEVLNARFEDWYLENLNTDPSPALYLDANATGSCKNVKLKIYSGSTYVSNVGKMSWDSDCEGFMGDGVAGDPIGTALASGIEGKIDTVASDLIVADALIDAEVIKTATIASDLILVDTVVDTIASDLIVLDAIVDGEVTKTATIASDLILVDTVVDTIASDLVVMDALIDTVKSDLIVLDAIVDGEVTKTTTIASDLILVDTVVDTIASDIVVLDPIIDTIASDLVVMDAILDTVASDIVVLDPIIDTIASDLIVADSVIDKIYSDTTIILSDLTVFIAKYTSDVP